MSSWRLRLIIPCRPRNLSLCSPPGSLGARLRPTLRSNVFQLNVDWLHRLLDTDEGKINVLLETRHLSHLKTGCLVITRWGTCRISISTPPAFILTVLLFHRILLMRLSGASEDWGVRAWGTVERWCRYCGCGQSVVLLLPCENWSESLPIYWGCGWFVSINIISMNINNTYLMFRWGRVHAISHHEASCYF